jgi:TatD DNase family protein
VLIDSHCHLDYFEADEVPGLLERARAAGVGEVVTIGTRLDASETVIRLAETYPNVWCTVGQHPHDAAEAPDMSAEAIAGLAEHPRVIGIGESGLDYFYDRSPRAAQQVNFRRHLQAARLAGVPLAIHARDADADIAAILQDERDNGGSFSFLLHCFSSSRQLAETAVAMGGYVSFSGILTFPKSQELRDIARDLPAERLLLETDAPYLAPVPQRGRRNQPAFVAHTAAVLAKARGRDGGSRRADHAQFPPPVP